MRRVQSQAAKRRLDRGPAPQRLGGNRADGAGQPVQVRLFGDDLDQLTVLVAQAQRTLASQPEQTYVTNSIAAAPELTIKPDPSRLNDLGLTTQQVGSGGRVAYQGATVASWAEPNGVPLGRATQAATRAMQALPLPPGTHWSFAGAGDEQRDAFAQLGIGLAVSEVLMYMVLTVLYESAIYPLVGLTALPLATVGAFLGPLAFGQTLSVPSFIGLIALFGLVGKNSILLVDRANDLRRRGLDRATALEPAGEQRLRPIVMTSVVLILSMLPVALKLAAVPELRAPLSVVLVGGMATSTLLSLVFVPVSYTYFDSFQSWLGRCLRWRPRLVSLQNILLGRVHRPAREPAEQLPLPIAGASAPASEVRRGAEHADRRTLCHWRQQREQEGV